MAETPSYSETTKVITIKVLFFASAREAAGNISETTIQLEDASTTTTTTGIRHALANLYPGLADMVLDETNLTLALNEEYVTQEMPLKDGDTIALIPPISGG